MGNNCYHWSRGQKGRGRLPEPRNLEEVLCRAGSLTTEGRAVARVLMVPQSMCHRAVLEMSLNSGDWLQLLFLGNVGKGRGKQERSPSSAFSLCIL